MHVGVVVFELHIPFAGSLKEKRSVVRSLRDKLRAKFEASVAEIALNDLHQRARIAMSIVSSDRVLIERSFQAALELVESNSDGQLIGWNEEYIQFDDEAPLGIPGMN
jgi:uncharacterized protein YlxP (DUF503 family)